ncbi:hypothetical protein TIFTF001_043811 [Ficus carica]|uniref:Uncharacterized protein n=1 Tax=Ficus carica TaxID=3494 RepID=A0AA87Z3W8_FICCA|nr:hypothetical protein TIFTF001_043811 [Ficus carica]
MTRIFRITPSFSDLRWYEKKKTPATLPPSSAFGNDKQYRVFKEEVRSLASEVAAKHLAKSSSADQSAVNRVPVDLFIIPVGGDQQEVMVMALERTLGDKWRKERAAPSPTKIDSYGYKPVPERAPSGTQWKGPEAQCQAGVFSQESSLSDREIRLGS